MQAEGESGYHRQTQLEEWRQPQPQPQSTRLPRKYPTHDHIAAKVVHVCKVSKMGGTLRISTLVSKTNVNSQESSKGHADSNSRVEVHFTTLFLHLLCLHKQDFRAMH